METAGMRASNRVDRVIDPESRGSAVLLVKTSFPAKTTPRKSRRIPSRPIKESIGGPIRWEGADWKDEKSPGFVSKGSYLRPISGGYKSQGIHGYNAVDLAQNCGRPVVASAAGIAHRVRTKGWNGGYGKMVILRHANGTHTVYGHLQSVFVVEGQNIEQGYPLGLIGSTGHSTGCHLHFEVRGTRNPF